VIFKISKKDVERKSERKVEIKENQIMKGNEKEEDEITTH
jgi:hypothetical protein